MLAADCLCLPRHFILRVEDNRLGQFTAVQYECTQRLAEEHRKGMHVEKKKKMLTGLKTRLVWLGILHPDVEGKSLVILLSHILQPQKNGSENKQLTQSVSSAVTEITIVQKSTETVQQCILMLPTLSTWCHHSSALRKHRDRLAHCLKKRMRKKKNYSKIKVDNRAFRQTWKLEIILNMYL